MSSAADLPPVIRLNATGGLGNRMFECLFAHRLAAELPGAVLTGSALPEWGIAFPARPLPHPSITIQGHRPDLPRLGMLVRQGLLRGIETNCLACRMDLLPPLDVAHALFPAEVAEVAYGDDALVINLRLAEILGPRHKDYRPLPIAYYDRLIAGTGLRPVFIGQLGDDPYSTALRARYPRAEFERSRGAMADFAVLRSAHHLVLPVSTFSWLAAWLSEASTIHLPLIGFFHPKRRPEVDLVPLADPRYRFHLFPADAWTGTDEALRGAIEGKEAGVEISARDAASLVHGVIWGD
ncbi:O-fucosyltransferase family protein [Muricoccus pecuniae]|uniref:Uncharacterized protein n=1 Tax=Muricoccus pecuniae TaxID=693023 RepID=A0A840XZY0_9PROT|nr:hypothetical protein [Roseomonas pecuniae]MBB5693436.1 hypothetical protein [Roseomonas pecuniae]